MKKKLLAVFMVSLMTVGSLTACGQTAGKETAGADKAEASGNEASGGKLTIWTNMEVEADKLQELGDAWGKEAGYEVQVIHESPDVQQFAQAAKSADGPDAIVGIPNDQLADYVNAGLAAAVPEGQYDESAYTPASVQACYVDGTSYAQPLAVESIGLFYNTDKVSEAPASWEDLVNVAKDNGGVQFDATSIYYDLGFLRASDGYIFKYTDGKYDVSDIGFAEGDAVKAYEFINDLCNKYNFVSADVTADIARANFQSGDTAFYIGGPWDIDGFTQAGTKFAVAPLPKFNGNNFVTPVGTQVSFVSSKSDDQDAAWQFINYLSENAALDLYEAGGRIPAKLSEQENDKIQSNEYTKAFIEQINVGEPLPTVSEMGQLWDIHSNNVRSMWTGELTPEQAAQNITDQLKEASELMDSGK